MRLHESSVKKISNSGNVDEFLLTKKISGPKIFFDYILWLHNSTFLQGEREKSECCPNIHSLRSSLFFCYEKAVSLYITISILFFLVLSACMRATTAIWRHIICRHVNRCLES